MSLSIKELIKQATKRPPNTGEVETGIITLDITDTQTFAGAKNSGKSYAASYLANEFPNVVLWDARWERFTQDDKSAMSVKAIKMPKKWITTGNISDLKNLLYRGKTHIIYHPAPLIKGKRTKKELMDEFDDVCNLIYDFGDVSFFVDECDQVCDLWHLPDGFFNLLQYAKHRNIGIVAITRRLQQLNPAIPRLSTNLFLFRLSGKDFKYIVDYLPDKISGKDSEPEESLKNSLTQLEDRYFYVFNGKELILFKPIEEAIL